MGIHKIGSDLIRPFGTNESKASTDKGGGDDALRASRADRVEISPQGRELAAQLVRGGRGLNAARQAEIQDRITSGYYNDPEVAEKVARSIFASGDLEA